MNIRTAYTMLQGLAPGQEVTLTRDGRDLAVTVQRPLHRTDGGGFGSWDHSAVTVGFGPGRFNTEVTAAGIAAGYYALTLGES